MGQIRKQVLQSSFLSYIGFLVGLVNTYFFIHEGIFTPAQYGLTQVIISLSQILAPIAALGMPPFINRFFPYYFGRLSNKENDMLTVAILFAGIGAVLVFSGCLLFEPFVVAKFGKKSGLFVEFYYWALLFSFFYLCFTILESYLWALKRTVLTNFMKETFYRLCVTVLIILYMLGKIDFSVFVVLFCCVYLFIVLILVVYLMVTSQWYAAPRFSVVSRRLRKNITLFVSYVYTGQAITSIARQIDTLALAGVKDLHTTGVYSLNQYAAAIIQIPYRGLQAIAAPLIAEHWRSKNIAEIKRIFQRSSINLLLIGGFLFINIWLNYDDGLQLLNIDKSFAAGKAVFLILAIYNLFELSTGAGSVLISSSPAWRFEFFSGISLLACSIPLNIYMAGRSGMLGVALATAGTLVLYNIIRLIFIRYRFNLWPYTLKTLYSLLLLAASYMVAFFLFQHLHGLAVMVFRSLTFTTLFLSGVFAFRLTPDIFQVIEVVKKRLKK